MKSAAPAACEQLPSELARAKKHFGVRLGAVATGPETKSKDPCILVFAKNTVPTHVHITYESAGGK